MLSLQSFLRKGVSLGYVGRNYNLKDLKDDHTNVYRDRRKLSEKCEGRSHVPTKHEFISIPMHERCTVQHQARERGPHRGRARRV